MTFTSLNSHTNFTPKTSAFQFDPTVHIPNTDSVSKPVKGYYSNLSRIPLFTVGEPVKWSTRGSMVYYAPNSGFNCNRTYQQNVPVTSAFEDEFSADLVDQSTSVKPVLHSYLLVRGALTEKETSFDDLLAKVVKGLKTDDNLDKNDIPSEFTRTHYNFTLASMQRGKVIYDAGYQELFITTTETIQARLDANHANPKILPKDRMTIAGSTDMILNDMDISFVLAHLSYIGSFTDRFGKVFTAGKLAGAIVKSGALADLRKVNFDHCDSFDDMF